MEGIFFGVTETFYPAVITGSVGETFQLSGRDKGNRNKEIHGADVSLSSLLVLSLLCPVMRTYLKSVTTDLMTGFFFNP